MLYKYLYKTNTQFDDLIMISDGTYLTGLYFVNSYNFPNIDNAIEEIIDIFSDTIKYLDMYFDGKIPTIKINYKLNVSSFTKEVLNILLNIPYGKTTTYSDIAKILAKERGINKMSNQAVGHAIGLNPISIIIPCHRIIGKNNNLVGYSGRIKNKIELLKFEGIDTTSLNIPKKGRKL